MRTFLLVHEGSERTVGHTHIDASLCALDISQVLSVSGQKTHRLKEACHVSQDFAGGGIMKVSLRGRAEKTLCDVLFDILVERRE